MNRHMIRGMRKRAKVVWGEGGGGGGGKERGKGLVGDGYPPNRPVDVLIYSLEEQGLTISICPP